MGWPMQRFTNLRVWQQSHSLALQVYELTRTFPSDERFGLVSQLRRAVTSIPTNVAEGSKRRSGRDYARFLNVAEGSLAEVEYLLMLSRDLGFIKRADVELALQNVGEIARMLHALRVKVESAA
jgi:four helix bundle protein